MASWIASCAFDHDADLYGNDNITLRSDVPRQSGVVPTCPMTKTQAMDNCCLTSNSTSTFTSTSIEHNNMAGVEAFATVTPTMGNLGNLGNPSKKRALDVDPSSVTSTKKRQVDPIVQPLVFLSAPQSIQSITQLDATDRIGLDSSSENTSLVDFNSLNSSDEEEAIVNETPFQFNCDISPDRPGPGTLDLNDDDFHTKVWRTRDYLWYEHVDTVTGNIVKDSGPLDALALFRDKSSNLDRDLYSYVDMLIDDSALMPLIHEVNDLVKLAKVMYHQVRALGRRALESNMRQLLLKACKEPVVLSTLFDQVESLGRKIKHDGWATMSLTTPAIVSEYARAVILALILHHATTVHVVMSTTNQQSDNRLLECLQHTPMILDDLPRHFTAIVLGFIKFHQDGNFAQFFQTYGDNTMGHFTLCKILLSVTRQEL